MWGVSPFSFVGTEIKTSRTTTTAVDVAFAATFDYQAAIDSSDGVSLFDNGTREPDRIITDAEARQSLIRGAIELCRQGTATSDRVLDANIPLDPDKTKNPDYPTTDTVDFYIRVRFLWLPCFLETFALLFCFLWLFFRNC